MSVVHLGIARIAAKRNGIPALSMSSVTALVRLALEASSSHFKGLESVMGGKKAYRV